MKGKRKTTMAIDAEFIDEPMGVESNGANFVQAADVESSDSIEAVDPTAAKVINNEIASKFREFCLTYPDHIHSFKLDELVIDHKRNGRYAPRSENDPDVKEMEGSIAANGQQTPGIVTLGVDGKLYVTVGTGRLLAIKRINTGRESGDWLPFKATVTVEREGDAARSRIQNATENWFRRDLTPIDKATIIHDLMESEGLTQTQVREKLGIRSKSTVSMYLKIAGLSDGVKQQIVDGKIAARSVYELSVTTGSGKKLEKAIERLASDSVDGRVSETVVAEQREGVDVADNVVESEVGGSDDAVSADVETNAVTDDAATTTKKKGKRKKVAGRRQRTARSLLNFINDEATPATAKKYGDKNLPAKLECFGKFVEGGKADTFLKNLAAL